MMQMKKRELSGGVQWMIEFDNGFAISVVRHPFINGTEVALIKSKSVAFDDDMFQDVISNVDEFKLIELMQYVSKLDSAYQVTR